MAIRTMASRLVDAADELLTQGRKSSTFRRRAVSTAYYAVFHALAKLCADYVSRSAPRHSDEYSRAYRALEHGMLKTAFDQPPLNTNPTLKKIGTSVVKLQAERHRADYLPPIKGVFTQAEAQELLNIARTAVAEIEQIKLATEVSKILALSLLIRARKI